MSHHATISATVPTGPRVLAGLAAAAVVLAGCGGSPDDASSSPPTSPAATSTADGAATDGAATDAPAAGDGSDPLAPTPSPAFFGGISEAWTIPGTAMADTAGSVSADRAMIGMWAGPAGGTLRVVELTATASGPVWEGACATADWWGNRLICGGDVVDPRTGEVATLPGAGTFAGGNADVLVLRDGEQWVAYDGALAEVWRADVAGDGNLYGFPDLPVAMAVDMATFAFNTVDLRTGDVRPTAMTVLAVDGFLEAEKGTGPLVAFDFAGEQVGEWALDRPECVPPYGERQRLADKLECPARYDGAAIPDGMTGFLLRAGGSPRLLEMAATGFAVDGEQFEAGDRGFVMAWMFGDEEHYLARFDSGFGLYASGVPEPVWEVTANDLLVAAEDVIVAFGDGQAVTVLTPAG